MRALFPAFILTLLLAACSTQDKKWRPSSMINDIHVRATDGELIMLAGDSVKEYSVFVRGSFPMDQVSIFLELRAPDGVLRSRAQIFSGKLGKEEKKCGTIYVGDRSMAGAVIYVEKVVGDNSTTAVRHTTSYPLRKLLMSQKPEANQPP
jgi:hypothetical protein